MQICHFTFNYYSLLNKIYTLYIMIILCHGNFREQIKKFVKLLLYTTENC